MSDDKVLCLEVTLDHSAARLGSVNSREQGAS